MKASVVDALKPEVTGTSPSTEEVVAGNGQAQTEQVAHETGSTYELEELRLQKAVAGDQITALQAQVTKLTDDHRSVSAQLSVARGQLREAQRNRDEYMREANNFAAQFNNEAVITTIMGAMLLTDNTTMLNVIQRFLEYSQRLGHNKPEVRERFVKMLSNTAAGAAGKIAQQAINEVEAHEVNRKEAKDLGDLLSSIFGVR